MRKASPGPPSRRSLSPRLRSLPPGGNEPTPPPAPTTTATTPPSSRRAQVVLDGAEVTLEVGPLAVHDDVAVLGWRRRRPARAPDGVSEVFESIGSPGPSSVRLVDVEAGAVLPQERTTKDTIAMSKNGGPEAAADAAQAAAGETTEIVLRGLRRTQGEPSTSCCRMRFPFDRRPHRRRRGSGHAHRAPVRADGGRRRRAACPRPGAVHRRRWPARCGRGRHRPRPRSDVASDVRFAVDSRRSRPARAALRSRSSGRRIHRKVAAQ